MTINTRTRLSAVPRGHLRRTCPGASVIRSCAKRYRAAHGRRSASATRRRTESTDTRFGEGWLHDRGRAAARRSDDPLCPKPAAPAGPAGMRRLLPSWHSSRPGSPIPPFPWSRSDGNFDLGSASNPMIRSDRRSAIRDRLAGDATHCRNRSAAVISGGEGRRRQSAQIRASRTVSAAAVGSSSIPSGRWGVGHCPARWRLRLRVERVPLSSVL